VWQEGIIICITEGDYFPVIGTAGITLEHQARPPACSAVDPQACGHPAPFNRFSLGMVSVLERFVSQGQFLFFQPSADLLLVGKQNLILLALGFGDAKIGAISEVRWDPGRSEAHCSGSSYVGGIERADEFFPRVWVEMNRRTHNCEKIRIVFLGDGASWIWDRVPDLTNEYSVQILDFYQATEHLSTICKEFYGEQTEEYWQHFTPWRKSFLKGKVEKVIAELRQMRAKCKGKKRHFLQGQISYFEGAEGMLQIRTSLRSERFLQDFRSTLRPAA
jgi:hypothetical protein